MEPNSAKQNMVVHIQGMTCHSCELTIEDKWKDLPGIQEVRVKASKGRATILYSGEPPSLDLLTETLNDIRYTISTEKIGTGTHNKRPSALELLALFSLVLGVGYILSKLGLFGSGMTVSSSVGFGAIFLIGLTAASSSCIAVVGGLLLSTTAAFNERYKPLKTFDRLRPVGMFVAGRVVGYTILGGLLGTLGEFITFSPVFTSFLIILAALYMLLMGLEMLHIAPRWVKSLLPGTSKNVSHQIIGAKNGKHPIMPFLLGAATFFLPCGFTQSLQIYALTTGSFLTSAAIMFFFALGTAPALFALGYASGSVKGKLGEWFFKFSGALVIVLGLWNIQNALVIIGIQTPWNNNQAIAAQGGKGVGISNVAIVDGVQVVQMSVGPISYAPSSFKLQAGIPVRWEIEASNASGCTQAIVSRQLGIQEFLKPGINTIEFTPKEKGTIQFSCSMGMARGSFIVQ